MPSATCMSAILGRSDECTFLDGEKTPADVDSGRLDEGRRPEFFRNSNCTYLERQCTVIKTGTKEWWREDRMKVCVPACMCSALCWVFGWFAKHSCWISSSKNTGRSGGGEIWQKIKETFLKKECTYLTCLPGTRLSICKSLRKKIPKPYLPCQKIGINLITSARMLEETCQRKKKEEISDNKSKYHDFVFQCACWILGK